MPTKKTTRKSTKTNPKAPYSQKLSAEMKRHYDHCLVQDEQGMWYLFKDEKRGDVSIIKKARIYASWSDFKKAMINDEGVIDNSLGSLFMEAYNRAPTKDEASDVVELTIMVWMQLCSTALDRLSVTGPKEKNPDGTTKRVHAKLENRKYEVIATEVPGDMKLPPQARTCLDFLAEKTKEQTFAEGETPYVLEADLKAYVIEQAERLKTRQDPWRIFQYYRPTLIQSKFIRLV